MDRQNNFFTGDIPGLTGENADTATPRDRIGQSLRDRLFAEEDSLPAAARPTDAPVTRRRLLREIQNASIAMAQATLQLDMHPGDPTFLRHYELYRRRLTEAVRTYEARFGRLTATPFSPM